MDETSLTGLIVESDGETVRVVTDDGMSVEAKLAWPEGSPGRLASLHREGDRFLALELRRRTARNPAPRWDAVAAAWTLVLRGLAAETLIVALGEEDFSLRFAAEWELFARGRQNLDLLRAGMASPSWRTRAACAGLMDHLADRTCAGPLLALLRDPQEKVRRAALHSVSCEECKDAPLCIDWVPEVSWLAKSDPIVRVRRIATLILGQRREDDRARTTLTRLLADRDKTVAARARWALEGTRPGAAHLESKNTANRSGSASVLCSSASSKGS